MATIGNEKVSQLVEITAAEVVANDLFYVVDTSARESKKMQASQLSAYLNASGSIYAVWADFAGTASYVDSANVHGNTPVPSASVALSTLAAVSSSWASASLSSSWAITASFSLNGEIGESQTSSYLKYQGFPNGTASFALVSETTRNTQTASFLQYLGVANGTASFAITSSNTNFAYTSVSSSIADLSITSLTASYLGGTVPAIASASHALMADQAASASVAAYTTATTFLIYSPTNGTASYAIRAGSIDRRMNNYGLFPATTQTSRSVVIDNLVVTSSLGTPQETIIDVCGTAKLDYTSSIENLGRVGLFIQDRKFGTVSQVDKTYVTHNVSQMMNQWNTLSTGSLMVPFNLRGQLPMEGEYYVAISSSIPDLTIDSGRTINFMVSSFADDVSASLAQPLELYISPSPPAYITFSSITPPGLYVDLLAGLLATGSWNITTLDVASQSVSTIQYTWKCNNLTDFSCSNNPVLSKLDYGFPATLQHLYCYSCSIETIANLSNTAITDMYCNDNQLTTLPTPSNTLVNLDNSRNPLTVFPSYLPGTMRVWKCEDTLLTASGYLPISLVSASFRSNTITGLIQSFPYLHEGLAWLDLFGNVSFLGFPSASLPPSMSYLNVGSCTSLTTMPTMSYSMSWLNITNASGLTNGQIEFVTSTLVSNGLTNGFLSALGFGAPPVNIYNNLTLLTGNGWTIQYDSYP